ncbi:hypothetical protein REPUB_Repub04eG0174800 [Reevesia pubescens]
MVKDPHEICRRLLLIEAESKDVVIETDWIENTIEESRKCLLGKLLSRRSVTIEAMKNVLAKVWRLANEMLEFNGMESPEDVCMEWCPFWIQIHGLPIGILNEKVEVVIGESLGDVEEVEKSSDKSAWGRYLCLRVRLNIHRPIKRVDKVKMLEGKSIMVFFRYERMPDFCYVCGRMDHHESECEVVVTMKRMNGEVKRDYGVWLRAESQQSLPVKHFGVVANQYGNMEVSLANRGSVDHNRVTQSLHKADMVDNGEGGK